MKLVNLLITWLKDWLNRMIDLSAIGENFSSGSYAKGERKMENEGMQNWTTDQMAEIYAKLEVAKMLTKMGTDMARQAADQITFYKMTNGIRDEFPRTEDD